MVKQFMAYDYKEVVADSDKVSFLMDGYENFGWEQDENLVGKNVNVYKNPGRPGVHKVTLRLKRNRKIMNKMELTRLQRNFEASVREIDRLENTKTVKATIHAIIIGIIGTAFMAGAVFAITARTPHIVLCILLAIPAFIGWALPPFVYKKLVSQETERIQPLIEAKYDEIYELCEKGNKLLF